MNGKGKWSLVPETCLYCEVGTVKNLVCKNCGVIYTGHKIKNKKRKSPQSFTPSFSREEERMLR